MTTLPRDAAPVQANPWWATEPDDDEALVPAPATDAAWLADEYLYYDHSAGDATDPARAAELRLVASVLCRLVGSMSFNRCDSAVSYVTTLTGGQFADGPRLPRTGSLRAPLARALATEAAWYVQLDTAAGDLAASALLDLAGDAERWQCVTPDDLTDAEAAEHEALRASLAGLDRCLADCPW